jgi:hypothetical protein
MVVVPATLLPLGPTIFRAPPPPGQIGGAAGAGNAGPAVAAVAQYWPTMRSASATLGG